MTPAASMALSFAAGAGLGTLYFWGLWLTVRRLPRSKSPGLLVFCSFLLRMTLFCGGLFAVTRGQPWETAACVAGFVAARLIVSRRYGPNAFKLHWGQ